MREKSKYIYAANADEATAAGSTAFTTAVVPEEICSRRGHSIANIYFLLPLLSRQIGDQRKMIAQCRRGTNELPDGKRFAHKNIINPQGGRYAGKSAAQPPSLFSKNILQALPDRLIGIGIRYIIKIAAHNHRVGTFFNFGPDAVGLQLPLDEPAPQLV